MSDETMKGKYERCGDSPSTTAARTRNHGHITCFPNVFYRHDATLAVYQDQPIANGADVEYLVHHPTKGGVPAEVLMFCLRKLLMRLNTCRQILEVTKGAQSIFPFAHTIL